MKIALIIYVVTIVIYWIGFLSVYSTFKKQKKEHPEKKYRTSISRFTAAIRLIVFSLIPVINLILGCYDIFCTDSLLDKMKEFEGV